MLFMCKWNKSITDSLREEQHYETCKTDRDLWHVDHKPSVKMMFRVPVTARE